MSGRRLKKDNDKSVTSEQHLQISRRAGERMPSKQTTKEAELCRRSTSLSKPQRSPERVVDVREFSRRARLLTGTPKERKMASEDQGATGSKRLSDFRADVSETIRRNFRQNRKASAPVINSDYKSSRMLNQDTGRPSEQLDPIYMALKMANEMAQRRRSSVSRPPPQGLTARGTILNSQDGPGDSTLEELPNDMSHSRESVFSRKQSVCHMSLTPSSMTSSSRSSPGPLLISEVKSSPNLTYQKSTESAEGESRVSARQIRKLGMKMKSFSLDCDPSAEQSAMRTPGEKRAGFSVLKGGRCFKVRPIKRQQSSDLNEEDSALESDVSTSSGALTASSKLKSLGPLLCVVTHEFRAKFADELELKKAERVVVFDRSDPDWWQGYKQSESAGRFPSTCVARILPHERTMQVVQNLNLWDGTTNLRLYRDQVVFAQPEDEDGLVEVRTEKSRRINCPAVYLMQVD